MSLSADSESVTRSEALRVWLLGGFRVSVGIRTIEENEWRLRKAASLVKLLALAAGNRLHREQTMYTLWPELEMRAASNNLRQTVHTARRAFDPSIGSRYLASRDETQGCCVSHALAGNNGEALAQYMRLLFTLIPTEGMLETALELDNKRATKPPPP